MNSCENKNYLGWKYIGICFGGDVCPLSLSAEALVAEGIMQQLSEIRCDINVLKIDVNQLKKSVSTVTAKNDRNYRAVSLDDDFNLVVIIQQHKVVVIEFLGD